MTHARRRRSLNASVEYAEVLCRCAAVMALAATMTVAAAGHKVGQKFIVLNVC